MEIYPPCRSTVVLLSNILVPLAMSAKIEDFVLRSMGRLAVQFFRFVFGPFPLCLFAFRVELGVGIVTLLD